MEVQSQTIENEYVVDVYEKIAKHFDHTRSYVWPAVKRFLDSLSPKIHKNILEIGCGNGRNMMYRPELNVNQKDLKYQNNTFHAILSVAVLHHLSESADREKSIDEIIRVLKPDGLCYIQVWKNKENPSESESKFVNWTEITTKEVHKRYYYLFCETEFRSLFERKNVEIVSFYEERDNYICIFRKK
jgi:ubiquinone/menaquinone biosynthesis C-methylase UbiE